MLLLFLMPIKRIPHPIYPLQGNVTTFQTHSNPLFLKNVSRIANDETGGQKILSYFANMLMAGTSNTFISYPVAINADVVASAENARVSVNDGGAILFTWTDNSGTARARNNDKVILTAWFPALQKMVYMLLPATRGNKSASVKFTAMTGFVADTWIGFVSHDEKKAGDSTYAGRIFL